MDKNRRLEISEAILEYFDDKRTFESVIILGITELSTDQEIHDDELQDVLIELQMMGDKIVDRETIPQEEIKTAFTSMLDRLIP